MPAGFHQMGEENASKEKGICFGIHIYQENIYGSRLYVFFYIKVPNYKDFIYYFIVIFW